MRIFFNLLPYEKPSLRRYSILLKCCLLIISCCWCPLSMSGKTKDSIALFPLRIDRQMVFVDTEFHQQIFHGFDQVDPFQGDIAWVMVENREGVIHKTGQWIIKPEEANIQILDLGQRRLILVKKVISTWYELHKWKLKVNIKRLTSGEEPFIRTKVSYQSFQLFDEDGAHLWTLNYPLSNSKRFSLNPFCARLMGEHLFIYEETDAPLPIPEVRHYTVVNNKLKHNDTFKMVWGFTKEGVLMQRKSDVFCFGFDGKRQSESPFLFKIASYSLVSSNKSKNNPFAIIWSHQGQFKRIDEKSGEWFTIPAVVMAKGVEAVLPLDPLCHYFLVRLSPLEIGIIDHKGVWQVHSDELLFSYRIPKKEVVVFKKRQLQHYFVWAKGVLYPLPEGYAPTEQVNDSIMVLSNLKDFKNLRKYGVYDIRGKRWTLPPRNHYLEVIGEDRLVRRDYHGRGDMPKGSFLINLHGKEIGERMYEQLWQTTNPTLIKVKAYPSDLPFFLLGEDGTELRW